jgi:hypothetical protein
MVELNIYAEAKDLPIWSAAMIEEIKALKKNKIWTLVTLPLGKKSIECK